MCLITMIQLECFENVLILYGNCKKENFRHNTQKTWLFSATFPQKTID